VSVSMSGEPIEALNDALPGLQKAIRDDPTVGEIARIGIITFSDKARTVLPLCDLFYAEVPELRCEGMTNFAEAFRVARREIENGIRALGKGTRFHTPVVFFLSDGAHTAGEDWIGPLQDLTDRGWKFRPEIVAFGFGDAAAEELRKIASRYAFMANGADTAGQVREIISTLIGSVKTTSTSLRSGDGGLLVEPDPKKFTPLPVHEV
jgi:uncharacterized protein YegL